VAYKCDGNDSANKTPKYTRGKIGAELNYAFLIQTVRTVDIGVRVTSGAARPLTGQILPRNT
jgi:hypothetical protein